MKTLGFMADDDLHEKIEEYCGKNDITKADFLKSAILEKLGKDKPAINDVLSRVYIMVYALTKNSNIQNFDKLKEEATKTLSAIATSLSEVAK